MIDPDRLTPGERCTYNDGSWLLPPDEEGEDSMRTKLEVAVDDFLRGVGRDHRPLPNWVAIYFVRLRSALKDPERLHFEGPHQPIYDPDHPLVHCPDCDEEYTACDLGNHYCPTCGESSESAEEVACAGCPCTESGGEPCCFCGQGLDAHLQPQSVP